MGAKFLFDLVKIEAIIVGDEIDGETEMAKTTRATDTMEIGLRVFGKVKVDDDVDGLNVDTTSKEIGRNEITTGAVSKVMENAVAVFLLHAGVDKEAGITEFGDLLGEKFNALDRVAKDDRLIDLKTRKECIETLNLLTFINKGIVLSDALESEFVHEIDFVGIVEPRLLECLDGDGESGREEKNLTCLWNDVSKEFIDKGLEFR